MRKIFLSFIIMLAALPLTGSAASPSFAFFSYSQVLDSMPDYIVVKQQMADLQVQYQQEMARAEEEFNKKYEDFVESQSTLAQPIRMKRQAELQELMEKNIAFKEEAYRLLQQAEQEALAPIVARLNEAIRTLGKERGYAFILNTDNNTVPYVNPEMGEDITDLILQRLK